MRRSLRTDDAVLTQALQVSAGASIGTRGSGLMGESPQAFRGDEEIREQDGPRSPPSPELAARHRRLMAMLRRMQGAAWSENGSADRAETPER
jgi:hypothetical protein